MLAVGFSYMAFIMLSNAPFIPTLLTGFIRNGCYILSNAFSASINMIMWFLSLLLFMWCIMFFDLRILYHPCIPGMNPTWSWWMIFLMYCWMRLCQYFVENFSICSSAILPWSFLSLLCRYLVLGLRQCWLHKTSLGVFHLLEFFEINCGGWGLALP